ncbi:hypothetical protein TSAR_006570 [Trichomalopsis sarcophagae]|uniref:Uncharacterized protein n=1 Tax=Trichomalopsis sarcophagae TaxID=543379 RepID=A0A232EGN8_9HYME|nr:hypothetical protein TSAR_006570 [Trichomalopsis sarcophagae]
MRSTEHYSKYKAVEHKYFTLYAAPVILKKLLSDDVYNHFMLYTVSCRLLSQQDRNIHIEKARKYLRTFVEKAIVLYGPTFISLNIHNLLHICDDVESTGSSLSELSAFRFESYLGGISNVIRSPNHIVKQYCNRIEEQEKFVKKNITIHPELQILKRKKSDILKIKYKGMAISLKHPNNTVLLSDKSVVEVCQFDCTVDDQISAKVKKYLRKESLFNYPCTSNTLNFEVSRLSNITTTINLNGIQQKLVKMQLNFSSEEDCRTVVVPLLH